MFVHGSHRWLRLPKPAKPEHAIAVRLIEQRLAVRSIAVSVHQIEDRPGLLVQIVFCAAYSAVRPRNTAHHPVHHPSRHSVAQESRLDSPWPEQWPDLKSFAVIESERCIGGKTSIEQRFYISSLPADADRLLLAVRAHWSVESRLHGCLDVSFADDQMRSRTGHAAHNLAILKRLTLNLIRLDPIIRKGGIKARRFIAAVLDHYREQLLGLV